MLEEIIYDLSELISQDCAFKKKIHDIHQLTLSVCELRNDCLSQHVRLICICVLHLFLTMHDHSVCVQVCVCADVCARASTYACVCLVIDFSVANPSVGACGSPPCPNGDVFSADITSSGRPLIRSQSFHNAPGK